MRSTLFVLLATATVVSADDKKDQLKSLEGTWEVVALVAGGNEAPKDKAPKKLVIKDGTLKGFGPDIRLTTDATKTPKWLNMTFKREEKDFTVNAVYDLKGDELKICMPLAPGKESAQVFENKRPEKFDTKDKPEMLIHVRRAK